MGYTTIKIPVKTAIALLAKNIFEVDSASDIEAFSTVPAFNDIVSACKSDHNHIILNLRGARFVDYKLLSKRG